MGGYLVYGLFTSGHDGRKEYFYVGKTRRTVALRVREHVCRSKSAHEDLYEYLRQLDDAGVAWEFETLRDCSGNEYVQDAERFEVIRLLRLGHDLRNMRYGDAAQRAELVRQKDDPTIRNAADVTNARLAREKSAEVRQRIKTRGRLRRKELTRLLKEEGIPSVQNCSLLSPIMRKRLTTIEDMRVERGHELKDLVRYAREYRKWIWLHEWGKTLRSPRGT